MKTNKEELQLEYQKIQLEVVKQRVCALLQDEGLPVENYELSMARGFELENLGEQLVFALTNRIAKESVQQLQIQYPENWKEAFKERWFPKWLLKKFPVKYKVEQYSVDAFYDKISLPEHQPYATFTKLKNGGKQ